MKTKICTKCGEEKPESDFKRKGGKSPGRCDLCYREKIKEYNSRPEVMERARLFHKKPETKAKAKDYRQRPDVRERSRLQHRITGLERSRRPEVKCIAIEYNRRPWVKNRLKKWFKEYFTSQADNIGEQYVKSVIRAKTNGVLKAKDVTSDLIELQRTAILLKRTIKQKKQKDEQHDTTTNL